MKTIKFFLLGVLSLFVSVLLLRYTIISLNYITIDFTPVDSKDIHNFGLTFGIQAIILAALSFTCITIATAAFKLSLKYYKINAIIKRTSSLYNHVEDERYNELCSKLRSTNDLTLKSRYINEYMNKTSEESKEVSKQTFKDIVKSNNDNIMKELRLSSTHFTNPNISFEPIDKTVYKD